MQLRGIRFLQDVRSFAGGDEKVLRRNAQAAPRAVAGILVRHMSRIAIITSTNRAGSCRETSVMVHCRNALTLSKSLGATLIECVEDAPKLEQKFDHIICNYASPYIPWRAYLPYVLENDARLWWMVNDHDIEDNMLLRNVLKETKYMYGYSVISNNTRKGYRQWILRKWMDEANGIRLQDCITDWYPINLNVLTYHDYTQGSSYSGNGQKEFLFQNDSIYWGSYRKWRLPYFQKYNSVSVDFSTSSKNIRKLLANQCRCYNYVPTLRWGSNGTLLSYNAALYIEDPHTHDNYAFPANRYYEALSYGLDIYFDRSAKATADKIAGAQLIDSPNELAALAKEKRQDNRHLQHLAVQERRYVLAKLKKLFA
jgi:hypothetical protein